MSQRHEVLDDTPEWEKSARGCVGSTLAGKWRLDSVLGIGGTSAVYAATHRNGHRAAIKAMRADRLSSTSSRARLVREAYAANVLARDGAVAVLDDGVDGGTVFLVMDLLEGETLHARARRCGGRLAIAEVLRIGEDLLRVIAVAHAKHIVHRDLKPENVFVETSGRVRVLDFGLARFDDSVETLTTSNATLGTPAFMSPEQAWGRAREADARSDVWGIGATIFTLLTGRFVHPSQTPGEMLIRTATQPPPSLADVAPETPRAIVRVVDRALAFHASERWTDARAMLEAWCVVRQEWERAPSTEAPEPRAQRDTSATLAPRSDGGDRTSDPADAPELLSAATSLHPIAPRRRSFSERARWVGLVAGLCVLAAAMIAERPTATTLRASVGSAASLAATALAVTAQDGPVTPEPAPPQTSASAAPASTASASAAPASSAPLLRAHSSIATTAATSSPTSSQASAPPNAEPTATAPAPLDKILDRRK